jgi:hypothetical protein
LRRSPKARSEAKGLQRVVDLHLQAIEPLDRVGDLSGVGCRSTPLQFGVQRSPLGTCFVERLAGGKVGQFFSYRIRFLLVLIVLIVLAGLIARKIG